MQEEWYVPSPRDKRRAEAFFATPAGQKALKRYKKIINSVSPDCSPRANAKRGKSRAKLSHK